MKKEINKDFEKASVFVELYRGASVCGAVSVELYSEEKIILFLEKHILFIEGEGMTMTSYYPSDIRISGIVSDVRIEKREKR